MPGIFKVVPRLRDWYAFVTVSGNFDLFQYFNFETDFLENKKLFQKTVVPFFN